MKGSKAVLVTGASTGIGRKITERLAAAGHLVYAGARKNSDLHALAALSNVQAIRLDVASPREIEAAVHFVTQAGHGLYGLVNNAGVAAFGTLMRGNDDEFDMVMDVNVRGVYRITKAFAPLIVAEPGRIITIGSITGILAGANNGVYAMSKHAMEAFTDSLAVEMASFGVGVSVIEPGNFNTKILRNVAERIGPVSRLPDMSACKDPDDVAEAVALALFEPHPRRRYLVVPNKDEARRTIEKQIEQLVQLNEGHIYTHDRSTLINMLDDALARIRSNDRRVATSIQRDDHMD